MQEPIISVSGLRGIVGETLTPLVAMRYVAAFAAERPPGPIVLTRDGRATGPVLADAIRAALAASGRAVLDAGVAATPTTGRLVRQHGAAGGIQISASHNPPPYNGIKLFGADGRVVPAAVGQGVLEGYRAHRFAWQPHDRLGALIALEDTTSDHLQAVLRQVDRDAIRQSAFHVLLDANHGAGSVLGQRLLEALGCRVTLLGGEPDGQFAHPPEPTATNLAGVADAVRGQNVAVGFCQDPDADRLALIDAEGTYVGEEYTLAVCLDHVLKARRGPVVTNCSTSRMSEVLAARYDVPFYRSRVGEAHVADKMCEVDAVFGGEGNGGPIDPEVGYVRDSFVGMALVLDAMASTGKSLAELIAQLPRFAMHKTQVALAADAIRGAMPALERHFASATVDRLDGLRLDWEDRWLLLRASNTEPIVRLVSAATSAAEAAALCDEAAPVLRSD